MRSVPAPRARHAALLACALVVGVPTIATTARADGSPADTVSLADLPTTWRAGAPIVALGSPTDIVLAPDGKRAYLVNGGGCTVEVLDLETQDLVGTPIVVGFEPSTLAISPDGRLACVANFRDFDVSILDLTANVLIGRPVALRGFVDRSGTTDVAITPDGTRAVATVSEGHLVGVIDLAKRRVISRIRLADGGPSSVVILPDGSRALVMTAGFDALWTIDLAHGRTVGTPVPLRGNPGDMALSPDGKLVHVLSNSVRDGNTLSTFDAATLSPIGDPIPLSGGSCDCPNHSLAITPDGTRAYVTNRGNDLGPQPTGHVKVIDLVRRTELGPPIETGPRPTAVVLTRDGNRAYVLNSGNGTISRIDIATQAVTGVPIPVGGRFISVARRRLLALEQLRHLEAAVDTVFDKDVAPRSGIKIVDFINNFGAGRRGGVKAEDIVLKIRMLRELVEQPCPKCEEWPTGYNNGLTNRVLDLRQRLNDMMDDGFPTVAVGQAWIDVLTAVSMELGFW